jgi:hypothetical protein
MNAAMAGYPDGQVVIMAVDPGDTTGWCWLAVDRQDLCTLGTRGALKVSDLSYGQLRSGGLDAGENAVARELVRLSRACWEWAEVEPSVDTFFVILEDFILRNSSMDRSLLSPVRINAKFQFAMDGSGVRVGKQAPSEALGVVTDERLRLWNLYDSSSGVHARDAARHAVLAARKYASQLAFRQWAGIGLIESTVENCVPDSSESAAV